MARSTWPRLVIPIVLCVATVGCGVGKLIAPRPFALSRAEPDFVEPETEWSRAPFLPWATDEAYVVVVDRTQRRVELYRRGERIRVYPAVFGREDGRKLFEGDRRTPSGVYRIHRKRKHDRFHRFLDIDYPTETDLETYRRARAAGRIPEENGEIPGPGRLLGIHGTDDERLNRLNVDWTLGCVSLRNVDVTDLYEQVPEGTLVVIRDGGQPWEPFERQTVRADASSSTSVPRSAAVSPKTDRIRPTASVAHRD